MKSPPASGPSLWVNEQAMHNYRNVADRVFAVQLLEYQSNPVLFTLLWCMLSLPVDFVREYMKLQPMLKVKLSKNPWVQKANLRPDTCFEAAFRIVLGLVVVLLASLDNRVHGLMLAALYVFDLFYRRSLENYNTNSS